MKNKVDNVLIKKRGFFLIIGAGTIGHAIAQLMKEKHFTFEVKDREGLNLAKSPDVMHICIPYSKDFVKIVVDYVFQYKPKLIVINSTVMPGTTKKIIKQIGFSNIVYSPIIGDHNKITEALQTFKKIIAYESTYAVNMAIRHFEDLGLKVQIMKSTESLELCKLLLTTHTAVNIAFMQEVERMLKKVDGNYITYNLIQEIYNNGYKKMRPNVCMPILYPGVIGGTCLPSNLKLLQQFYKSNLLKAVEKSNKRKVKDDKRDNYSS
jgi:UDP-N-acetyl-D-mannosaminuronate dehydrogenase